MAKKKASNTQASADGARFTSRYTMTDVISDEMSRLVGSPTWKRNWHIVFGVLVAAMFVMYMFTTFRNIFVSVALFALAILSWFLAEYYPIWQQKRLRRMGFVERDAEKGELRCEANVFDDRVEWKFGQDAEPQTYQLSELRRARHNSILCVLDFGNDRFVPIPCSSMTKSKYQALTKFIDKVRG